MAAGLGCQVFWLHQRRTLCEPVLSMTARATRLQAEGSEERDHEAHWSAVVD